MVNNKKVVVILPAFNASRTLRQTYAEIPFEIVDEVILTDDASTDETLLIAEELNIKHIFRHNANIGYGGNQKTCYKMAMALKADIIIMLHPDYQYTPKLIPSMVYLIANNVYQVVLGSRILGKGALQGGMPLYKYVANRGLTFIQNILLNAKLSEYHTGYRAFSAEVLRKVNYEVNSNDFIFDNQFLSQIIYAGYEVGEIACPTKYFEAASEINFVRSLRYGFGVLLVSIQHFLQKRKIFSFHYYKLNQ
jgi:glycosyltransferase involved in cell wall biosynthesis